MIDLMAKSLFLEDDIELTNSQFPSSISNYGSDWVRERLNHSVRNDKRNDDPDPCKFVRDRIRSFTFPDAPTPEQTFEDVLPPLKTPNQTNRKPFTVIKIESGTYYEKFPIELADGVSISGDSLRRVAILPNDDLKEKGCGLHQKFKQNTFTNLNFKNEVWSNAVTIELGDLDNNSSPINLALPEELQGQELEFYVQEQQFQLVDGVIQPVTIEVTEAIGTISSVEEKGSGSNKEVRVVFRDIDYVLEERLLPNRQVLVRNNTTGTVATLRIKAWDLRNGYLLLKDEDNEPLQLTGSSFNRGTRINNILTFKGVDSQGNDRSTKFKLRKGDVLVCIDLETNNRQELVRVEEQEEDVGADLRSASFSIVPHRLNEKFDFNNAYVYFAPRAEWQTLCNKRVLESEFNKSNNTYPSTIVQTNSEEVGQQAFLVGNANYVFQVVFKETTNFAFAFRRDRPRVFASPYIQNCSSITTKGGGGILVDGFLPKQPDDDFPERLLDKSVTDAFPYSDNDDQDEIQNVINLHLDGADILVKNIDSLLGTLEEDQEISTKLDELNGLDVNYNSNLQKCKKDFKFIIDAVTWQMVRGGNDKVYDTAKAIASVIYDQTKNTTVPLWSRQKIIPVYTLILGKLKDKTKDLLEDDYEDISNGDCATVISTVDTLLDLTIRVIAGKSSISDDIDDLEGNKRYDANNLLIDNADTIINEVFDEDIVTQSLESLGENTNYNSQIDKCKRDCKYLLSAIAWHLGRGGNIKVIRAAEVIYEKVNEQTQGNFNLVEGAYIVVIDTLISKMRAVIEDNLPGRPGDCAEASSAILTFGDIIEDILTQQFTGVVNEEEELNRENHVALPEVSLAKLQNAELRSFVLDAFTQINTFGGWGHLIRNNGYAQLVSTFTTFCDHGVKVESGGLINLSNSVCDFGFYGLIADGYSKTHYLDIPVYKTERGSTPGTRPTNSIYLDVQQLKFNSENPVYKQRVGGVIEKLKGDYIDAKTAFMDIVGDDSVPIEDKEEKRNTLINNKEELEKEAAKAIQFNSTTLFSINDSMPGEPRGYRLRDGELLEEKDQIPRGVSFVDRLGEESEDSFQSFETLADPEIEALLGQNTQLSVTMPLIRIGYLASQRIPHQFEIGLVAARTPVVEKDTIVKVFITTTLTSSAHGFEYVGSGNDYTNALPENGGVPRAENQLLETDGGRVFTSSTDVKGDFRVGSFFTVKQSTGAVSFNPTTLELINLSSIGPFTSNGVLGTEVIEDLTNEWQRIVPNNISNFRGASPSTNRKTIATVESINFGLSRTFISLSDRVASALLKSESNNKLLEALNNPKLDYGSYSNKLSLFFRSSKVQVDTQERYNIYEDELNDETPWTSNVSNMDNFLWELGGRARQGNLLRGGNYSSARNRASFTLNFLIDTSESMAKSGQYWKIKKDLITLFSNMTSDDSVGLYKFSDTIADKKIVKFKRPEFFDELSEGQTLTFYGSNVSNNRTILFIEGNEQDWQNNFREDGLVTIGKGVIEKLFPREKKVLLKDTIGLIQLNSKVTKDNGLPDDATEVEVLENGLIPSIHNLNKGIENILEINPFFNFDRSIKISLLKDIGAYLPTTKEVVDDGLLEPVVYEELKKLDFFNRPYVNFPELIDTKDDDDAYLIPGKEINKRDSNEIWQDFIDSLEGDEEEDDNIELSYKIVKDKYYEEDSIINNVKWFYADIDPLNYEFSDEGGDLNITQYWEYLDTRINVNLESKPFDPLDIKIFGQYSSDNPEGYLTQDVIENNEFFEEQKSLPELDIVFAGNNEYTADQTSVIKGIGGLITSLEDSGTFNWKIGSVVAKRQQNNDIFIQDLYENDVNENPRTDIVNTTGSLFGDTNREIPLRRSIGAKRGFYNNRYRSKSFNFYKDNEEGHFDTSTENQTTTDVVGDSIFWVKLVGLVNFSPVGTIFNLSNETRGAREIEFDYSQITLNQDITELTVTSSKWSVKAGETVRIKLARGDDKEFSALEERYTATFTLIDSIDAYANFNQIVRVEPAEDGGSTGKERFGFADPYIAEDGQSYSIRTNNNLTLRDLMVVLESNQAHPLYDGFNIPRETKTTTDSRGNIVPITVDIRVNIYAIDESILGGSRWRIRTYIPRTHISLKTEEVKYTLDGVLIKVSVLNNPNQEDSQHPLSSRGGWALDEDGLQKYFYYVNYEFVVQEVLDIEGKSQSTTKYDLSTTSLLSLACNESKWRPNSFKVIILQGPTSINEDVEFGSYFYARGLTNSSSKLLVRRFDSLFKKYIEMYDSPSSFVGGRALKETLDGLITTLDDDEATSSSYLNYSNDTELETMLNQVRDGLLARGEMRLYWYLGGTLKSDGVTTIGDGNPGTISISGKELRDQPPDSLGNPQGNVLSPESISSYLACEEDLIFTEIDQLHLAVRENLYEDSGNYGWVRNYATDVSFFSIFTRIQNPENFNNTIVKQILVHRSGSSLNDEFDEDRFTDMERETGTGIDYTGDDVSDNPELNDFTSSRNTKKAVYPRGLYYPLRDVKNTLWIKDLFSSIYNNLGEGKGVMYTEFGEEGNLRPSETASQVPAKKEILDRDKYPAISDFELNAKRYPHYLYNEAEANNGGDTELPSGFLFQPWAQAPNLRDNLIREGLQYSEMTKPYLVTEPYAGVLPSFSIDNRLLRNADLSSSSPGIVLGGSSALYEATAAMIIDSSNSSERLLDNDTRTLTKPRNPARQGTININAIISDGEDIGSFESLIIKHFIKYNSDDTVNISTLERSLFEEIFLDKSGALHIDNKGNLVQQRFIYTNEVLNSLIILAYHYSDDSLSNFKIDKASGFGDPTKTDYRLPLKILSNSKKDNNTKIFENNENTIVNMLRVGISTYSIVDNMKLIIPFYRGSQDAVSSLVSESGVEFGDIRSSALFPNPYRFTSFSFPVNESITERNSGISDSLAYVYLGEEGPSINFTFNLNSFISNYDLYYIRGEEIAVRLGESSAKVTLYSKLGYYNYIVPNVSAQSIATQTVVFDPGFGQRTSQQTLTLAQNLDSNDGVPFKSPETVVGSEGLVLRNNNGFPIYEQNPEANLTEQRINYIESLDKIAVKQAIVNGFPIISKRDLDNNINGEYLGRIEYVESPNPEEEPDRDNTFLLKIDRNGNNRNAVYSLREIEEEHSYYRRKTGDARILEPEPILVPLLDGEDEITDTAGDTVMVPFTDDDGNIIPQVDDFGNPRQQYRVNQVNKTDGGNNVTYEDLEGNTVDVMINETVEVPPMVNTEDPPIIDYKGEPLQEEDPDADPDADFITVDNYVTEADSDIKRLVEDDFNESIAQRWEYIYEVDDEGKRIKETEERTEYRWIKEFSTEINTGGIDSYVDKIQFIKFNDLDLPILFLKDNQKDNSKVLVLTENNLWRNLIEKNTVYFNRLKGREENDDIGKEENFLPIINRTYFYNFLSQGNSSHFLIKQPNRLYSTSKPLGSNSLGQLDNEWVDTLFQPLNREPIRRRKGLEMFLFEDFNWELEFDKDTILSFADSDFAEEKNTSITFSNNFVEYIEAKWGARAGYYILDETVPLDEVSIRQSNDYNPSIEIAENIADIKLLISIQDAVGESTNFLQTFGLPMRGNEDRLFELERVRDGKQNFTFNNTKEENLEADEVEVIEFGEAPFYIRTIIANPGENFLEGEDGDKNLEKSDIFYYYDRGRNGDLNSKINTNEWTPLRSLVSHFRKGEGAWRRLEYFFNSETLLNNNSLEELEELLDTNYEEYLVKTSGVSDILSNNPLPEMENNENNDFFSSRNFTPNNPDTFLRNIKDTYNEIAEIENINDRIVIRDTLDLIFDDVIDSITDYIGTREDIRSNLSQVFNELYLLDGVNLVENIFIIDDHIYLLLNNKSSAHKLRIFAAKVNGLPEVENHWEEISFNLDFIKDLPEETANTSEIRYLDSYKLGNDKIVILLKDNLDQRGNVKITLDFYDSDEDLVKATRSPKVRSERIRSEDIVPAFFTTSPISFDKSFPLKNNYTFDVLSFSALDSPFSPLSGGEKKVFSVKRYNIGEEEDDRDQILYSNPIFVDPGDEILGAQIIGDASDGKIAITLSNTSRLTTTPIDPIVAVIDIDKLADIGQFREVNFTEYIDYKLTAQLNLQVEGDTTRYPLNFKANLDPYAYPRFPHGPNWLRDGLIGVNQGIFSSKLDANPENQFSWNSLKYRKNDLWRTIRETMLAYDSLV